jgi:protein-disulfide isomerase
MSSRLLLLLFVMFSTLFAVATANAKPRFEVVESALLTNAPNSSDYALGNPEAPVVLVEYASMTCPHCAKFHKNVLPELTKRYIETGKLVYVFRPYPLNEPALKASMLTDCIATEQGVDRYYTFTRVLFEAQNKWAFDSNWMSSLQTFAKVGGVPPEMFEACITDSGREIRLLNMKRAATKELGVDRTPMIFINGHRYDDEQTLERVSAYIDFHIDGYQKEKTAAEEAKAPAKAEEAAPVEKK